MHLFVYGVLMDERILLALTGRRFATVPAVLDGFRRYLAAKEGYPPIPAIVPELRASVAGVLIRDVDAASVAVLDDFEEVGTSLYARSPVRVRDAKGREIEAHAYVAGPGIRDCLEGSWSPEDFLDRYSEDYLQRMIPRFLEDRGT